MLVTKKNFDKALLALTKFAKEQKVLGYDTETFGLPWWHSPWGHPKPGVFAAQFATDKEEFYFDFHHSPDKLGQAHFTAINSELTQNPETTWMIQNAKFDLHHSANHGVFFAGRVHCTKAIARVVNNLESEINLDALGQKYLNVAKLDVISIIKERGHVTNLKKFGHNDKTDEVLHFDRLELKELYDYGCKDTRLVFDIGVWQVRQILAKDRELRESFAKQNLEYKTQLANVMYNEHAITKVLFDMEREGVLIDRAYCEEAYENEVKEYRRIEKELNQLAGCDVDWNSAKQLKPIFDKVGEPYSYTEKGNASFDKDALEESESELAKSILRYRYHYKRAHTYFENFIWLADKDNVLHADAQQAGTQFGRMSYWTPNLQNVPKKNDKTEKNYKVRRAFIPKPGGFFAEFDYRGAEFNMMIDYAREMPVVEQMKAGVDPHGKLGQEMQLKDRDAAKTMQFRILYGAGGETVGKAIGYKGADAKTIGTQKKNEYFQRMPAVASLLDNVKRVAAFRGYIINWLGRLLEYTRQTSYKAPNGLIQSGVGDLTKVAQVRTHAKLEKKRSRMLLQIHDAILFWIAFGEEDLIPVIREEMESVYPHKVLPIKTDSGFSAKSWADLTSELPAVPSS